MAYSFDATSGETRDDLVELVIASSFSAARYTAMVQKWLNDAVTDVCRRLKIQRAYEVLAYDASGLVVQPERPFFHVEELWWASAGALASGERDFISRAELRLEPLPEGTDLTRMRSSSPFWYSARRVAYTSRYPQLQIVVLPTTTAGFVAIKGLQRPAVMDAAGDLSGLGADLDDALVAYAKARCFRNEDDFEMSKLWQGEYELELRGVVQLENDSDGPDVVPGTWDC